MRGRKGQRHGQHRSPQVGAETYSWLARQGCTQSKRGVQRPKGRRGGESSTEGAQPQGAAKSLRAAVCSPRGKGEGSAVFSGLQKLGAVVEPLHVQLLLLLVDELVDVGAEVEDVPLREVLVALVKDALVELVEDWSGVHG